jgi:hypothetical protein
MLAQRKTHNDHSRLIGNEMMAFHANHFSRLKERYDELFCNFNKLMSI